MAQVFQFKTDFRMFFENTIVANSEEEAKTRLKEFLKVVLEEGSLTEYASSKSEVSTLESVEVIPANFSSAHHTLIEMGYSFEQIKGYSEEDAEEEVYAAISMQ